MTIPSLVSLPYDLLFLITQKLTDPCDLLALRRTHSTLNTHLKARFTSTFENTPCTRPSSSTVPRKPTIDSMLFWAGTHNHLRFAQAKLCRVWWPQPAMMRNGARSTLTYNGMLLATCAAARAGHFEVFSFLHEIGCAIFRPRSDGLEMACFETAVSEGDVAFTKQMMGVLRFPHTVVNAEGKTPLRLMMETHSVELVEFYMGMDREYLAGVAKNLMGYAKALQEHEDGWCQRVLSAVLGGFAGGLDVERFVGLLSEAGKRKCGPECDMWLGRKWNLQVEELGEFLRSLDSAGTAGSYEEDDESEDESEDEDGW